MSLLRSNQRGPIETTIAILVERRERNVMAALHSSGQYFTIDEANRMLPLVRVIVADIVALASDLEDRQNRIDSLNKDQFDRDDPHSEEVRQMQQEIDDDESRLDEYINELIDLGVELQDPISGEVDFRTQIDGQEALFCWKLGELDVSHWHTETDGFSGRQSLLQGATPPDGFPS